ncbi:Homeobox protein ceh-5 [Grifola frondosa]|uniref:Homeobox protein ceh-5 n=1 Tax=Grifola frondosa TaxID=5627 RepID=A0A1C7MPG5_GRIFR|nr:Homeobox protein ceh-5 [Grifola frondosa]
MRLSASHSRPRRLPPSASVPPCPDVFQPPLVSTVPIQPIYIVNSPVDGSLEKKPRHRMTDSQLERLEALYRKNTHPTRAEKQELAEDVGMSMKSVTIWFQNRRQTRRKKNKTRDPSPLIPHLRRFAIECPADRLSVTSQTPLIGMDPFINANQDSAQSSWTPYDPLSGENRDERLGHDLPKPSHSRAASVHSSESRSSSSQPPRLTLWQYMLSSPPEISAHSSSTSLARGRKHTADRGRGSIGRAESHTSRRRNLEWACARMEKRHKIYDEDASDDCYMIGRSDTSPGNLRSKSTKDHPRLSKALQFAAPKQIRIPHISIPREYDSLFSPDVILGASLLLTFKYSVESDVEMEV